MPFLDKPKTHRTPAYLECVFICGAFSFSFCLPLYCNFRRSLLNGAPRFLLLFCFSFSLFPPQCLHTTNLSIISSESRPTSQQSHWLCFISRQGQEVSALAFATGAPVQGREPQVTTLFVGPETAAPTTLQPLQPRCSP